MASPIPASHYSNFFAYVALNCLGFEGALAALQAGEKADPKRFLLPSSPKDFMSSETLAHRLHSAISEYPSQGAFTASIIASRSAETANFARTITQLCDYFDDWFVIPDWQALSIDKPIFISIRSYLNLAYRIIPVKDQRTLLAGWHPGSLISTDQQGHSRTN